jgi:hypothetical protein
MNKQEQFLEWEKNKTFPFTFSLDCPGYFREDVKIYNRLSAELLCADIEHTLNYEKDYFHVTLDSEEQIAVFETVEFEWWKWWNKRDAVHIAFHDMFIGNGLTNKIIKEI